MPTGWIVRLALIALPAALVAPALADAGPKDVLARVYALYAKADSAGMPAEEAALKRFMVPDLAHAWARNGTPDAKGDLPADAIDFDPFIEGQDFKITGVKIGDAAVTGTCASVVVTFRNMGRPTRLTYTLAQVGHTESDNAWRIADLAGPGHPPLRKMLKLKPYGCG